MKVPLHILQRRDARKSDAYSGSTTLFGARGVDGAVAVCASVGMSISSEGIVGPAIAIVGFEERS